jgi:hypothetical protein
MNTIARSGALAVLCALSLLFSLRTRAQGNYEIQVYGSELVEPAHTMVESHRCRADLRFSVVAGHRSQDVL